VVAEGNQLSLTWDVSGESDFVEYWVYRSTTSGGGYTNIVNRSTNSYTDINLLDGTPYYYVVSAVDEVPNEGTASDEASGTPADSVAPGKVTGVVVTVVAAGNALNLTWTASAAGDFANYKVYRDTTPGFSPSGANLIASPATNQYLDTNLIDETTYYYRISAVDEVPNEGTYSDEASGTPQDSEAPAKVTGVSVSVVAEGNQLSLSWTANAEGDLAGYKVYRSETSGFTPAPIYLVGTPGSNTFLDTSLTDDTPYYYKITAIDEVPNEGIASDEGSGTPHDSTPPAKVLGVSVTVIPSGEQLNLTWTASAATDFANYKVYRGTTPGFIPSGGNLIASPSTNSYFDSGLTDEDTYYYRVSAVDEVPNEGTYSDEASGTPQDTVAPAKVTGLLVSVVASGNSLSLTWNASGASDFVEYWVYRSTTSGGPYTNIVNRSTNSYTDINLLDGTPYYYVVSAVDEVPNEGITSDEASGTPDDSVAPGKVTGVVVTVVAAGEALNLTWTASAAGDLANYKVYRSLTAGFSPAPQYLVGTPSSNSFLDSGLTDDTPYYYRITAVDEVPNEGTASDEASGTPHDSTPPSKVAGLSISDPGIGNALDLSWTENSEADLAGYKIYRDVFSGFTPNVGNFITQTSDNSYRDTGIDDGTTYYYVVTAIDEVPNEGTPSDEKSGVSFDVEAPPQVVGVIISVVPEGNKLNIQWNASTAGDLALYNVYRDTTSGFIPEVTYLIASPATNYYNDSGLQDGETYYYKITAQDEVPNEGTPSAEASATPEDTVTPPAVTGLSIVNPKVGNRLDLSWDANPAPDLDRYKVYRHTTPGFTVGLTYYIGFSLINSYSDTDEILLDNETYYYQVTALDEVPNEGVASNEANGTPTDETKPPQVTGLTATDTGIGGELQLDWTASTASDLALYRVYRSTTSGFTPGPANNIKNTTINNYLDTEVTNGITYYYRVSAVDDGGPFENEGTVSAQRQGTPSNTVPPAQLTGLTTEVKGNFELLLQWDANSEYDLEGYKIYRSTTSGFSPGPGNLIATIYAPQTNHSDTGLTTNLTYYYRVAAFDNVTPANEGTPSVEVGGTPGGFAPGAVTNLQIFIVATGNALNLQWDNLSQFYAIAYYNVYRSTSSGFIPSGGNLIASPTTNYYNDSGLSDGIPYYYRITGVNVYALEGNASTEESGTPQDSTAPAQVIGLTINVNPVGETLDISWSALGGDVAGYLLYRNTTLSDFILLANLTVTYYNNSGLTDGANYYYKVSAYDEVPNEGINSTPVIGTPADTTAPGQVTGLAVTVVATGNELSLTWDISSAGDFATYLIYRSDISSLGPYTNIVNRSTNSYTDTGLIDGQEYYYKVSAVDDGGPYENEGLNSSVKSATPSDTTNPATVTGVSVTVVATGNKLNIQWDNMSETIEDLAEYRIYRSTTSGFPANPVNLLNTTSNTQNWYNDSTGLLDGTTYYYKIRAVDEVPNLGGPSLQASGTPDDSIAPGQVTGLLITVKTEGNKLDLQWDAATGGDVAGYSIYRNSTVSSWILHTTTASTIFNDASLVDGRTRMMKYPIMGIIQLRVQLHPKIPKPLRM
jgi:fibronectin type 3 domain-containing protein